MNVNVKSNAIASINEAIKANRYGSKKNTSDQRYFNYSVTLTDDKGEAYTIRYF